MGTSESVMPLDLSQSMLRQTPHSFGQSAAAAQRKVSPSHVPDSFNCSVPRLKFGLGHRVEVMVRVRLLTMVILIV